MVSIGISEMTYGEEVCALQCERQDEHPAEESVGLSCRQE